MTVRRLGLAIVLATVCSVVFGTRVFTDFDGVRIKARDVPASPDAGTVRVRAGGERSHELVPPFALIAHVHNGSTERQHFSIAVDGSTVCDAEVGGGSTRRIDCATSTTAVLDSHEVLLTGPPAAWQLEYLELATHYGRSSGPFTAFIVPAGLDRYGRPAIGWTIAVWILLTAAFALPLPRPSPTPRAEIIVIRLLAGAVAGMFVVVLFASRVSPYRVVISPWTFFGWLGAVFVARAWVSLGLEGRAGIVAHLRRQWSVLVSFGRPLAQRVPLVRAVGVGLLVGWVFFSYAADIVQRSPERKVSSLLLISRPFFDRNPLVRDRQDIRDGLALFKDGYDGQYFYYMTYDPFLKVFRGEPRRYRDFIDAPPYRYGRIGFSLLTKALSANNPRWYPAVMVTLVLSALAVCGALLSAFARRHGASAWYGMLVILIPGYWHSVDATLPEPIAVALFLGGYLLLLRKSWWAAGVLFGLSMMVRETGGAFVLALVIAAFLAGQRRESVIVACLAFAPVVLWRLFVGWVFKPDWGWEAFTFHPDNFDVPLRGVRQLWIAIANRTYFDGLWEMTRAGLSFPPLVVAGATLVTVVALKQPSPVALAGLLYAAMAISMNFRACWIHVGNAERVSMDLFLSLAMVSASMPREPRMIGRALTAFWCAAAVYMFAGTYFAANALHALLPWW